MSQDRKMVGGEPYTCVRGICMRVRIETFPACSQTDRMRHDHPTNLSIQYIVVINSLPSR